MSDSDVIKESGLSGDDMHIAAMTILRSVKMDERKNIPQEKLQERRERVFRLAMAGALMGDGGCMMTLAELYHGKTVNAAKKCADPVSEAIRWWKKGAAAGNSRCYTNLGLLYMHKTVPGGGDEHGDIPLDPEKAFECFVKGYELGDIKAGRHVGLCYQQGISVERDASKAYEWFSKAAERGDSSAELFCANCLLKGEGVSQNVEKAIEHYKALVECKGHDVTTAAYALARIYSDGVYAEKNEALAKLYYESVLRTATEHEADMAEEAKKVLLLL